MVISEPRLRLKRSSHLAGLELTTARSVGQRLTHLNIFLLRKLLVAIYATEFDANNNDIKLHDQ